MVVLLRSIGVPARLAVGYTLRPQDRIPDTNVYVLSEANAFAWPEVYFPGLGWVEFNPTPSEPRVNRSGQDDTSFSDGGGEEFVDESTLPERPAGQHRARRRGRQRPGNRRRLVPVRPHRHDASSSPSWR